MSEEDDFYVEPMVRLWTPNERDTYLEVGIDGEGHGLVQLRTGNEKTENYYGRISLDLTSKMARQLGQALIDTANRVEQK